MSPAVVASEIFGLGPQTRRGELQACCKKGGGSVLSFGMGSLGAACTGHVRRIPASKSYRPPKEDNLALGIS